MLLQIQRTLPMRQFQVRSSQGVEYIRRTSLDDIVCAVIIYPLEEGGGLFPEVTVDWYTNEAQARRHAKDWQGHGHRVEVVCAQRLRDC